jgi:hypothetical protein
MQSAGELAFRPKESRPKFSMLDSLGKKENAMRKNLFGSMIAAAVVLLAALSVGPAGAADLTGAPAPVAAVTAPSPLPANCGTGVVLPTVAAPPPAVTPAPTAAAPPATRSSPVVEFWRKAP